MTMNTATNMNTTTTTTSMTTTSVLRSFGTTRVSRYQKKHSPTHTYHDHQSSFSITLKIHLSPMNKLQVVAGV